MTAGAVTRFAWNAIPPLQRVGVPFAASLTARDADDNLTADFADTVTLSALAQGEPATVTFSPSVLSNFVGGTWAGELIVRDAVTNLQFRASDALGHTGLANAVNVVAANDLALTLIGPTEPVALSNNFIFTLTLTNSGPAEATGVVVTNVVSAGVHFLSARVSQGSYTRQGEVLVCNLGALRDSSVATIEITLRAALPGVATNLAVAVRAEPDTIETNNTASAVILITNRPPLVTLTRPTSRDSLFGPTNVLVEASASDTEGIAKVEFFNGADRIGEGSAAPYRFLWERVLPGVYTLSAVATDSFGATNGSAPVTVSIGDGATNLAPQITIVHPALGSLFNAASNGLGFSVVAVNPNVIPTDSIRLTLNGVEVTGRLGLTGETTNRLGTFTDLTANTVYFASLVAADESGRTASLQWTFDTFDVQSAVVIEAEDYNYSDGVCTNGALATAPHSGGRFQDDPLPSGFTSNGIPVNAGGIGYLGLAGLSRVDFNVGATNQSEPANQIYRPCDPVTTRLVTKEVLRAKYQQAGVSDYVVTRLQAGDWMNYTRTFTNRDYLVYLRASSPLTQELRLGLIGGDRTTTNQTEAPLGVFHLPTTASDSFAYTPLIDPDGRTALVRLTNVQTVRLTVLTTNAGAEQNYLVFVPGNRTVPPTITEVTPLPNSSNVPPDAVVLITVANGDVPVNTNSLVLHFNEAVVTPELRTTADGVALSYRPPQLMTPNTVESIQLSFRDSGFPANEVSTNWTFMIASLPVLPVSFAAPSGRGGDRGFVGRIHKARNDAPSALFVGANGASNTVARAELQLSNQLIDPATGLPFVNEAAGAYGDGSFVLTNAVNFEQRGTNAGIFPGDIPFPWVTGDDPDFMAMELRAYLELTAGVYRFGVNFDEGFQLAVGANPSATSMVLSQFEGGREELTQPGPREFEFVVLTNGLYGFRLLWWEGKGPAHLEWYARNRQTGERVLINSTNPAAVAAYQLRLLPAAISIVQPDNNSLFSAPADIAVIASAAENEKPAAGVMFFAGDQRIGTATRSPFSILWTNIPGGSYLLTAVMTNRSGNAVTSAPVRITVNAAPVISAIPNQNVTENVPLAPIAFTVSDLETPASNLVVDAFSSNTNLLPAANIVSTGTNADRMLTLLPLTNQFGTATVTVVVSDGITNASTTFTLTVRTANLPPILQPIVSQTVDEGTLLSIKAIATDSDAPAQTLAFSLDPGAPEGMTIGATNGVLAWTPTEAQGPGIYLVMVRVTDNGSPPRTAVQPFEVAVKEVNRPPVLAPITNQTLEIGSALVVTNTATDPDLPANHLVFSLAPGAPAGATVDSSTGLLTWTPAEDARRTNAITIRVTDDGSPALSDEKTLMVTVGAPLSILNVTVSHQKVTIVWRALPSQSYQVQYKTDLRKAALNIVPLSITATNFHAVFAEPIEGGQQKLYRIVQLP